MIARCFVTRALPGPALERLRAEHEVDLWEGRLPPPASDLREHLTAAEGVLSMLTDRLDAELIAAAPDLRAISNYAVGVDNVDVDAASERGIPVGHTPDVLTEATADLAVALMLAVARRIVQARDYVVDGEWLAWEPGALLGQDLHGATVGIVGHGRIGQAVARRLHGFGTRLLHTPDTPLDELLAESDFVSLHVPLTGDTRGLIGKDALERMKTTAILVNTARGEVVDTQALATALRAGTVGGAALDVTDPEPIPAASPLLGTPNLLIVPHIGSATHAAREAMAEIAVSNLLAGLAGKEMAHCLNASALE